MQMWVCDGFNQLVSVCEQSGRLGESFSTRPAFYGSAWKERLSCRHGERAIGKYTNDCIFPATKREKETNDAFFLFVVDIFFEDW